MGVLLIAGQVSKVGERIGELSDAVVVIEIEAYPEPKALGPADLRPLKAVLLTNEGVAKHVGGSQGFVRDQLAGVP